VFVRGKFFPASVLFVRKDPLIFYIRNLRSKPVGFSMSITSIRQDWKRLL